MTDEHVTERILIIDKKIEVKRRFILINTLNVINLIKIFLPSAESIFLSCVGLVFSIAIVVLILSSLIMAIKTQREINKLMKQFS